GSWPSSASTSPTTVTALLSGGSSLLVTLPIDRRLYCHQVPPSVSPGWTVSRSTAPSGLRKPPTLKDLRQVVGLAMYASIARASAVRWLRERRNLRRLAALPGYGAVLFPSPPAAR